MQARLKSARLPRKVLGDIGGETMLGRVVRRLQRARRLDEVVIAAAADTDESLVAEGRRLGVHVWVGSELDVLDRFVGAARAWQADVVVRVPSDCPLIDPGVVDEVVAAFWDRGVDYVSNTVERTFPRGLDCEAVSVAALERAWREARLPYERVHVTPYIYEHPELFRLWLHRSGGDYSNLRWTVDEPADLRLVRVLYARLGNRDDFTWREALAVVEADPALAAINAPVRHKELTEG